MQKQSYIRNLILYKVAKALRSHYALCSGADITKRCPCICTLLCALCAVFSSCSMIDEDLLPCAPAPDNYTLVDFVYTYNMSPTQNASGEEEDWFDSHVGAVHLYVFDDQGIYLFDNTLSRAEMPQGKVDFTMRFDSNQLKPGQTYQFVAMAQGNHTAYVDEEATNVFFIPLGKEMIPGESTINDYEVKLDRDDDHEFDFGVVNFKDQYGNNQQMIDTIWSTKPGTIRSITIANPEYVPSVEKQPDIVNKVQIEMMRITNAITVNLLHPQFNNGTNTDDYHVLIDFPDGNGRLNFEGDLIKDGDTEELYYRALRKTMVNYTTKEVRGRADDEETDQYALESVFGVSRLMIGDHSELQIRDATRDDNKILFSIPNFSEELAKLLNDSFSDDQEFLDREYDYTVEVQLDENDKPLWYSFGISILGWARRVYLYDL